MRKNRNRVAIAITDLSHVATELERDYTTELQAAKDWLGSRYLLAPRLKELVHARDSLIPDTGRMPP